MIDYSSHILKFISEELLSFLLSHSWDFPMALAHSLCIVLYFSCVHVSRHPFDSLSSWRMKALSNLSSYFPGYLAEGMSYKNCSKWPKRIRALPFLLPVIRLSKASGSWIIQNRYIHFSRFSWDTTGLGVFALLQVKGLDPGSQAGCQHGWEWTLLQSLSLCLPHSWVSRLGRVPLHFLQDAFLAQQLSAKSLCSFKITPVWNIVNPAWYSCLLLCIWCLPSQESGVFWASSHTPSLGLAHNRGSQQIPVA